MFVDELEGLEPLSRDQAMESIRAKLSEPENARYSAWWEGMSYLERVSLIGCSAIFGNTSGKSKEMRRLACDNWVDLCGSQQAKLINSIKRLSRRAKSHGVCHV